MASGEVSAGGGTATDKTCGFVFSVSKKRKTCGFAAPGRLGDSLSHFVTAPSKREPIIIKILIKGFSPERGDVSFADRGVSADRQHKAEEQNRLKQKSTDRPTHILTSAR